MTSFLSSRRNFLIGAAATTAGALCSSRSAFSQSAAPIHLRISSSLTTDEYSEHYAWFQRFSDNLQAAVGDKIKLDYYPNGQLGNENDVVQQVKTGTVDMMISGSSYWATAVPEMGMLDLGYLFDSYDQARRHLHGNVGQTLAKLVHDRAKVTILGWSSLFGARSVYTKRPVGSLADVRGIKIRVLPVPIFIQSMEALGAIPTPIGMNELYTALQTGIVDGLEQNVCTVLAGKYYEVAKNCYETEHMFTALTAVASARAMAKIPAEMQSAFQGAAQEASVYQYGQTPAKVQKAKDELIKAGVAFTAMSANDRDAARQAVKSKVWQAFAEKYPLTKPLLAEIDANRA